MKVNPEPIGAEILHTEKGVPVKKMRLQEKVDTAVRPKVGELGAGQERSEKIKGGTLNQIDHQKEQQSPLAQRLLSLKVSALFSMRKQI